MLCGLITGFAVWAFTQHLGPLGLLLGGMAGFAAWWVETQIWPETTCWWPFCRGRSRVSYSWFTSDAWRFCPVCRGSGRRRRLLAGRR